MGLFGSKHASSSAVLDVVTQFLRQDNWKFTVLEDKAAVRFSITGDSATFTCFGFADDDKQQFRFFVMSPANVPDAKRAAACELVTRANYGLNLGNLELDMNDGEVRYKSSISVRGGSLTPDMVGTIIYTAISTFDRYYPALMAILYAGTAPSDAIGAVEK